ncbi:MAG: TonB-dependent receptor [Pseudomonadales bacterium]|nr:TonB-dependent receptor [Pseudomonadales bacterium]
MINIITQKDSAIGFKTGSQDHKQADVHWQHNFESGASTNLNFSHWDRNNSGRITNPDNFARSNTGHSPGQVYDHEQGTMLFSNISYQGFSSQLNYARLERGGWYGNNAALPQDLAPRIETVLNFEIEQSWELHNDFSLNANFGLLKTDLEEAAYLPIPAGTPGPGGTPPAPEDFFRQDSSEDFSNHANIALHWKGVKDHQLFMEIGYVHSEVKDSGIVIATLQGPPRIGTPDEALVLKGSDRALYSLTLQDQWAPIDSLEFTLGARYDNYDDWGDATSPRFATVWRPHDKHIFKFQFAKAFRPPTLANQYPGPNTVPGVIYNPLREETISTTEISYLYNDINHQLRVTSFYTEVENLIEFIIRPGEFPEWRNRGDLSSTGLELEWEQKLNREWNWNFNISYTHAENSFDNDNKLTGSVAWLSNLGINWQTLPNLQQSLSIRYVGDQEAFDNRSASRPEHFPGYTIMDYSLTVDNVLNLQGLSAQVTINNISDKQYDTLPNPNQYPQGLPQGERNGWLDISYKFN